MKKLLFFVALFVSVNFSFAQNNWHIVGNKIKTIWADSVNPSNVLDVYPRP